MKNKKRTQVLMRLPENVAILEENLYGNFKKRAEKHSKYFYRDNGKKPSLFRIHKQGSLFNSSFTVLIVRNSFTILYSDSDVNKEIGFTVIFRHSDGNYSLLTVLKQGKAYYEPCEKP